MALFKSFMNSVELSKIPLKDGNVYFVQDTGYLFVDVRLAGSLVRLPVCAPYADKLRKDNIEFDLDDVLYVDEIVEIDQGGTGATSIEEARRNLHAAPMYHYGNDDLVEEESSLDNGVLYLTYDKGGC